MCLFGKEPRLNGGTGSVMGPSFDCSGLFLIVFVGRVADIVRFLGFHHESQREGNHHKTCMCSPVDSANSCIISLTAWFRIDFNPAWMGSAWKVHMLTYAPYNFRASWEVAGSRNKSKWSNECTPAVCWHPLIKLINYFWLTGNSVLEVFALTPCHFSNTGSE